MIKRMAYKFRIYPDPQQERLFRRTAGSCRLVYNLCLEQKRLERHRSDPRSLSSSDQQKELRSLKAELPWLKEVPHHCLQQAIADLHKGFLNFFAGRAAHPKHRGKFENESFRFPDPKQIFFKDGYIFLPKAKWVRMIAHRIVEGTVKNVTVSSSGDHWNVSIQVEQEVEMPVQTEIRELGGDLGVVNALVLSDGTVYDLPRMSDGEKKREADLHKVVSRRKKGSKNRQKAIRDLRRFKAKIARRRKDAKHKMTTAVVGRCTVLYLEDLKIKNMTASARGTVENPGSHIAQKSGLNHSILDVSPGETRVFLEYKMRQKGGIIHYVNPAYTSMRCSACGHVEAANRPTRDEFACVSCGHAACADNNAAHNILNIGQKTRTGGLPGMACESNLAGGRKQEEDSSSQAARAA